MSHRLALHSFLQKQKLEMLHRRMLSHPQCSTAQLEPRAHSAVSSLRTGNCINTASRCHSSTTQPSSRCNDVQQHWTTPEQRVNLRRLMLTLLGSASLSTAAGGLSPSAVKAKQANPAPPAAPDAGPVFFKTPLGSKVQELAVGSGTAVAQAGDPVLFDYVLRRANGYFIYSTVEGISFQPKDIPVGPVRYTLGPAGELIQGLSEVLEGMKVGGKRRALIPPEVGYLTQTLQPQPPTYATARQLLVHSKEPLLFEVQLLRIRDGR